MSSAPVDVPNVTQPEDADDEEMPRVEMTRRRLLAGMAFIVLLVGFLYWGLPRLAGLDDTWRRIEQGDLWWLALAGVFTVLSFGGYVLLFQGVFVRAGCRLTLSESYQITMAGLAATRVFAAGGAGGVALTAWALRRAGMSPRTVADRTIAFLVLQYGIYMAAIVLCGLGLRVGVLNGPSDLALTLIPAVFAALLILLTLLIALTPTDLQRRLDGFAARGGRFSRPSPPASNPPPAVSAGVRIALQHARDRDPALLGAVAYWGFQVAVLWASFHAFGQHVPGGVVVMAYFLGMLGNLLPLPGGVGGVDGGMIGVLIAFEVPSGTALVAVLTYRVFAFWLPTIPGAIAFFQLRRTVARWRDERERGVRTRQTAVASA
jgi:uncharacterized membrane protein YbhN (UPF0104 family)